MNKECPKCKTEMVEQSYTDPETGDKIKQLQCFKCGYSHKEEMVID